MFLIITLAFSLFSSVFFKFSASEKQARVDNSLGASTLFNGRMKVAVFPILIGLGFSDLVLHVRLFSFCVVESDTLNPADASKT